MAKVNSFSLSRAIWLAILILVPIAVIVMPMGWIFEEGPTLCLWSNLTGQKCYGCGMTRAVVSLFKLNFTQAWEYNKLVVIVFPVLGWIWLQEIRRLARIVFNCQKTGNKTDSIQDDYMQEN